MIDFRYHIVSLISVFLALAVGIALGAGPLKETIGDTLTGQVEQLRTEKDELRIQLDQATTDVAQAEAALDAAAPALLDDVLADRRVAVVELAEVDPAVHDAVVARLEQSGAEVTATARVTDQWTDPAERSFRQSLAGTLLEYLDPVPDAEAGTEVELAEALVQGLTTASPTDPDAVAEPAAVVLQLLSEAGLVELGEVTRAADAVVVIAGPTVNREVLEEAEEDLASAPPAEAEEETERQEAVVAAGRAIALAAQDRSQGAVVAGGELVPTGLVQTVRDDEDTRGVLSTIDSAHTVAGEISVPLALAERIGGSVGHYGPAGEVAMPPRVDLPPFVRGVPSGATTDGTAGG